MPKVIDNTVVVGDVLAQWSVPEYEKHTRNTFWFVFMTVLGLLFVTYAIFSNNFLFALVLVLFGIILFLQSNQDPIVIPFKITNMGVVVNDRFYAYSELEEFYILFNPADNLKVLFIETQGVSRPKLRVPLMDMDPNEIRITLRQFLSENLEKEEEPLSDMLARKWLFH